MAESLDGLYPVGPQSVPEELLAPTPKLTRLTRTAFTAVLIFLAIYLGATIGFLVHAFDQVQRMGTDQTFSLIGLVLSIALSALMLKSIWIKSRRSEVLGIKLSETTHPSLWKFIQQVIRDVSAPEPRNIYLTADVNAAVTCDLSWFNLFWPAKKDLILGAPLINLMTLSELKIVIGHEFGHFTQKTSALGRWVYLAQQIVGRFTRGRDGFDEILRRCSSLPQSVSGFMFFVLFWGWALWLLAWILRVVIWSLRAIFDSLSRLLLMASRALGRELELQADLVAVSIAGSDSLVNTLLKLPAIELSWRETLNMARSEAGRGRPVKNLLELQTAIVEKLRFMLDDPSFARTSSSSQHASDGQRVFTSSFVYQSQMWHTHPTSADREENAKRRYLSCAEDGRDARLLFDEPNQVGEAITALLTKTSTQTQFLSENELRSAVDRRFARRSQQPEFNGCYFGRSPMRSFANAGEVFLHDGTQLSADDLYPSSLKTTLREISELSAEIAILERIQEGAVQSVDGVIRCRGAPVNLSDLPESILALKILRAELEASVRLHDQRCRSYFQQLSCMVGAASGVYHRDLVHLWHYATHVCARLMDALLVLDNTEAIIAADGKITDSEQRRMVKVLIRVSGELVAVHSEAKQVHLPSALLQQLDVKNWEQVLGGFSEPQNLSVNWRVWLPQARYILQRGIHCFSLLREATLDHLLEYEAQIAAKQEVPAPEETAKVPETYEVLLAGSETPLQRKLDWWSRFQLAQGSGAELARGIVSVTVVATVLYLIGLESVGTFDRPEYRTHRSNLNEISELCEQQDRTECVRRAIAYFGGSASDFIELLEQGCQRNNYRNCGFLGTMYQFGDGVSVNLNQARHNLERACSGDDDQSCNGLAILLESADSPEDWRAEALGYFEKACELGEQHGCLNLASRLLVNRYGSSERARAETLISQACEGGIQPACVWDMVQFDMQQIGRLCNGRSWAACYATGTEYMSTPSKLIRLLETDCDRNQLSSCQFLGVIYAAEDLIPTDLNRSRHYLEKACSGGLQQAC